MLQMPIHYSFSDLTGGPMLLLRVDGFSHFFRFAYTSRLVIACRVLKFFLHFTVEFGQKNVGMDSEVLNHESCRLGNVCR